VDNFDLKIIRLLTRDSRTSYKNIASVVGITPSATTEGDRKEYNLPRSQVEGFNGAQVAYSKT
jgi:AsnC-like helix-turn-helix protein